MAKKGIPHVPESFISGLQLHFNDSGLNEHEALRIKNMVQAEFGDKPKDKLSYEEVLRMVVEGENTRELLNEARRTMKDLEGTGVTQPNSPTVLGVGNAVEKSRAARRPTESHALNRIEG